jgi:hypothetical protein
MLFEDYLETFRGEIKWKYCIAKNMGQ